MSSKNNSGLFANLKTNQKYTLVLMAFLAVCLVVCLIVIVIASIDFTPNEPELPSPDINSYTIGATEEKTFTENDLLKGTLVVVNKDNKFDLEYNAKDLTILFEYRDANTADGADKAYKTSGYEKDGDIKVTRETAENLHNMLTDLFNSIKKVSYVAVGYRSFAGQPDDKPPAPSGYSDFHTGTLVSLKGYVGTSTQATELTAVENEDMYNWLLENAHNYGFIQRYPEGKEESTNVSDCLSCFKYVGIAHATYMKNKGYCLEEYISFIKESKPTVDEPLRIEVRNDGVKEIYAIYYVDYNGGSQRIQVPTSAPAEDGSQAKNFTVSATNMGGVIVTVKLK